MARGLVYFALVAVLSSPIVRQSGDKPVAFEIADIHPSAPSTNILNLGQRGPYIAGERFELQNATLLDMIRFAYSPANARLLDADKVVGGPSALDFNRFDVIAKAPPHSSLENMKLMLQALLASRFNLAIRNDSVPLPAYALTAGKKPLLKEADGSEEPGCKLQQSGGAPGPGSVMTVLNGSAITLSAGSMISYVCRNMTMAALADSMRSMVFANLGNNRVVDQTGLKGVWNFDFKFSLPLRLPGSEATEMVTFTDAVQKQLGLDLVMTKVPTPVLVVEGPDDGPTPNPPGVAAAFPPLPEEFEVADVKPTAPDFKGGKFQVQPSGRVEIQGATLRSLVVRAWGLSIIGSDQVLLGPKFMDTARFDIVAKAPMFGAPPDTPATAPNALPVPQYTNGDSINPMLRSLLTDRFGLTSHTEDRPLPSLTLSSVKPKLQKADPAHRTGCHTAPTVPGTPSPMTVLICENMTMAQFAVTLPRYALGYFLGGPSGTIANNVVDATGLEGAWDFTFSFSGASGGGVRGDAGGAGGVVQAADPSGTNLFEALGKQLGLKLEATKSPGKVMVIDHLEEKPKEP